MSEEWTDWFDHDGRGCPCKGMWVRVSRRDGTELEAIATGDCNEAGSAWDWDTLAAFWSHIAITRYRIRRPRTVLQLIEMIENLPAPAQPRVDA